MSGLVVRSSLPAVDPAWDQTGAFDPDRAYLVASVQRSGSTLLAMALVATGQLGVPLEYLNEVPDLRGRLGAPRLTLRGHLGRARRRLVGNPGWRESVRYRPPSLVDFVDGLRRIRTSPSGVFGAKVHHTQVEQLRDGCGVDAIDLFAPRRAILIHRRDHLRQALSTVRALRSGRWVADQGGAAAEEETPTVAEVDEQIARIEADESAWRAELDAHDLDDVLELAYEDLDEDYAAVLGRVFAFLGQPGLAVPPRQTRRQADARTERWVEVHRARMAVA